MSETHETDADAGPVRADIPADGAVVLFDGVCNFCSWSVQFIYEHDDGSLRFAPLQSAVGAELLGSHGLPPDYFDSLVYLTDESVHTKSDGALHIARHLDAPYRWAWHLRYLPRPLRDLGYDLFGRVRYTLFGKKDECMVPGPDLRSRFLDTTPVE